MVVTSQTNLGDSIPYTMRTSITYSSLWSEYLTLYVYLCLCFSYHFDFINAMTIAYQVIYCTYRHNSLLCLGRRQSCRSITHQCNAINDLQMHNRSLNNSPTNTLQEYSPTNPILYLSKIISDTPQFYKSNHNTRTRVSKLDGSPSSKRLPKAHYVLHPSKTIHLKFCL